MGELGSGATQLATAAASSTQISNTVQNTSRLKASGRRPLANSSQGTVVKS